MADLRSQYAEEVETLRHILNLPDPRETMPRSSTVLPKSRTKAAIPSPLGLISAMLILIGKK